MSRHAVRPLALGALLLVLVSALPQAAGAAPVNLSFQRSAVKQLQPQSDPERAYANVDSISTDGCGAGRTPIAVGWAGTGILTTGANFYAGSPITRGYRLDLRAPLAAARIQSITVCATGITSPRIIRKDDGAVASCGAGKVALGVAVTRSWAYDEASTFGKPLAVNRWQADAEGTSTAICVASAAFARVSSVRTVGAFGVGAKTTTVVARCPRGKRALTWGFESTVAPENAWNGDGTTLATPYVASAVPSTNSWTVTFRTPDGAGAVAATSVAAWATCGVPAAR
jgi:hypothetical protein